MLIDAARGIIYDRHMFIAQATGINLNLDRIIDTDNIFLHYYENTQTKVYTKV
jgi:hypothetical protein